jgi:hypothetical protein
MPAAPALNEQELAPAVTVDRPKSVNTAFILWLVLGAILIASVVLVLAVSDDTLRDAARTTLDRQGKKNPSDQELNDAVKLIRTVGVVYNLVFLVLTLVFAYFMRAGRNWARIAVTVVGALQVVLGVLGFGANILIILVELLIVLAAVFFMYRPDAKPYFASRR